jgi:hypothetical protein
LAETPICSIVSPNMLPKGESRPVPPMRRKVLFYINGHG